MHLKVLSAKQCPFCLGLNVLTPDGGTSTTSSFSITLYRNNFSHCTLCNSSTLITLHLSLSANPVLSFMWSPAISFICQWSLLRASVLRYTLDKMTRAWGILHILSYLAFILYPSLMPSMSYAIVSVIKQEWLNRRCLYTLVEFALGNGQGSLYHYQSVVSTHQLLL